MISDTPPFSFFDGRAPTYSEEAFKNILPRESRLLISSGGDSPVLDNAGDGNSLFAKAFLDVLELNDKIMAGLGLFVRVRDLVQAGARNVNFEQVPEFKVIDFAGHEVGFFFFRPLSIGLN